VLAFFAAQSFGQSLTDETIEKLIKVSGIEYQVESFPETLVTQLSAINPDTINATDSQLDAIFAQLQKVSSVDLIKTEFRRVLQETLTEQQAKELITWYESELGSMIIAAERAGSSEESMVQMQQNASQLLEDQTRLPLALKILGSVDAGRLVVSTQKHLMTLVQVFTTKLNRPFVESITNTNTMNPEQIQQLKTAVEQQTTLFLLYSLKGFSVDQLNTYAETLEKQSMQLYHTAFSIGYERGLSEYTTEVTGNLAALFNDEGWNIAPYLSVADPEGADLTFQAVDENSPKLLLGWTGDTFDFYVEAQQISKFKSFKRKWREIEKGYKETVDNKKILGIHKGSFTSPQGIEVEFRVTGWNIDGQPAGQIVFLLQNNNISYVVAAVPVDMNQIESVTIRSIAILKTALLLK
jgi:hypothetical protein